MSRAFEISKESAALKGRVYKWIRRFGPLVGASSEEMEDDTGGDPVVVLLNVGAERGPVVVNVEQTDFPVTGWMEIQSATYFVRQTVRGSCVAADAANGGVCARTANQALDKRGRAPAISAMVEVTRPEMISIKDILGGANRYDAVAAVRDELQPRFEIPAKRPQRAV